MDAKLTKLIGLKMEQFNAFVDSKDISLREARLITTYKPGDEMALTSVILSALRLIKEFRKMVLSAAGMATGGQIHVFTEVTFPEFPDSRIDGLILIVKGGVIKNAALCEMKNGTSELDKEQIERYQQVAKFYSIPRLITVSNQFVSDPTQFPILVKQIKSINLYHFSWSYLLTLSYVLLFDNDTNIADEDQVEIMREVVSYLEYGKSGVCGFNQMKKGWSDVVDKINHGALLKSTDPNVHDTVISWQQEERDLALILSRSLGVLVDSGESKYRGDLKARLDNDTKELINGKRLTSILKVRDAVSDIRISALFEKRTIEMHVSLKPPADKQLRGQLGWIKKQLATCNKKNELIFAKIKDEILIEIWLKSIRRPERVSISRLDDIYEEIKGREIKEFRVICVKDYGKKFASRIKFVEIIEQMAIDFYSGAIQHLVKWEPSAPKMGRAATQDANVVEKPEDSDEVKPMPAPEIHTAPCPLCHGALVLSTLKVGTNICPHCEGRFEAG